MERKEIANTAIAAWQILKRAAIAVLALTIIGDGQRVEACAFAMEPCFTFTNHPDLPLDKFAAGQLGILHPNYARSYLLVAYRYLSGQPLTPQEQQAFVHLWYDRFTTWETCTADTQPWLSARGTVPGAGPVQILTERPITPNETWQTYCNCQTDAFTTAARTLKGLITKYGAASQEVKSWLDAQDQVFSNCGYATWSNQSPAKTLPSALPSTADRSLQEDRAYQIASANFYAQDFDDARRQFDEIARDNNSPWKQIAAYLSVRSLIRQATLPDKLNTALLEQADGKLQELLADPTYASLANDMKKLQWFIQSRLNPPAYLQDCLSRPLDEATIADITKILDRIVGDTDPYDVKTLEYEKLPDSVKTPDMIDWIFTYQCSDDAATRHAISRWRATHSVPWLVAAAAHVKNDDPAAAEIMSAAAKVNSGPARWSLFSDNIQFTLNNGDRRQARAELDKVLANPVSYLPAGSLNELRTMRLPLSVNLSEFIRFGVQRAVATCVDDTIAQVPDDIDEIIKTGKTTVQPQEFTEEAGTILNTRLPLEMLAALAASSDLPASQRNNVAWTSWVRAILIGDAHLACPLAELAKAQNPAKGKYIDAYLNARTDEERAFAAAFLMLHYSSAQPNVVYADVLKDSYGDEAGWWWAPHPGRTSADSDTPSAKQAKKPEELDFVTAKQAAQATQELAKLKNVEGAPDYLTRIVLAFAKSHPEDARVPEALNLAVKCTRYGTREAPTTALSKQAFELLHTRYKESPWTKKTPYYY